jgi:hypothetical protein
MGGADVGESAMPAPVKDGTLTARTGAAGGGIREDCEGSVGDRTDPRDTDRDGDGASMDGAEETGCCPSEGEGSGDEVSVEVRPVGWAAPVELDPFDLIKAIPFWISYL